MMIEKRVKFSFKTPYEGYTGHVAFIYCPAVVFTFLNLHSPITGKKLRVRPWVQDDEEDLSILGIQQQNYEKAKIV